MDLTVVSQYNFLNYWEDIHNSVCDYTEEPQEAYRLRSAQHPQRTLKNSNLALGHLEKVLSLSC